jgi:hypothetical protein
MSEAKPHFDILRFDIRYATRPEFFDSELKTEGLGTGCGSLSQITNNE